MNVEKGVKLKVQPRRKNKLGQKTNGKRQIGKGITFLVGGVVWKKKLLRGEWNNKRNKASFFKKKKNPKNDVFQTSSQRVKKRI